MLCVVKNILILVLILLNDRANAKQPKLCLSNNDMKKDLMSQYLVAMNRSLNYFKIASSVVKLMVTSPTIPVNILYGLFLMRVNLRHALQYDGKKLNWDVRNYLKILIEETANVASLYQPLINVKSGSAIKLAQISNYEDVWVKSIKRFSSEKIQLNTNYVDQFEERWPDSCMYILETLKSTNEKMYDFDNCFIDIIQHETSKSQCFEDEICIHTAVDKDNLGYLLSHRIILFTEAVYCGQCSISTNDELAIRELCEQAFAESVYLGNHWFEFSDLLFEFVAVCSLSGYSDFIQEAWFNKLLTMQEASGEFTPDKSIKFDECRDKAGRFYYIPLHFDVVAIAALSGAARYIAESTWCLKEFVLE